MMIIHHTEPRTHTFQLPQRHLMQGDKPKFDVHPKTGEKIPVMVDQPSITLMPGMNVLTEAEYDLISHLDGYKDRIDEGQFEEVYDGETLPDDPEMLAHIFANTLDVDQLREWSNEYEDELSVDLTSIIEDQLVKLTNPREYARRQDDQRAREGTRVKREPKLREKKKLSEVSANRKKIVKKKRKDRPADFDMDTVEG